MMVEEREDRQVLPAAERLTLQELAAAALAKRRAEQADASMRRQDEDAAWILGKLRNAGIPVAWIQPSGGSCEVHGLRFVAVCDRYSSHVRILYLSRPCRACGQATPGPRIHDLATVGEALEADLPLCPVCEAKAAPEPTVEEQLLAALGRYVSEILAEGR